MSDCSIFLLCITHLTRVSPQNSPTATALCNQPDNRICLFLSSSQSAKTKLFLLKLVEEPSTHSEPSWNASNVWFSFASSTVTVQKEVESYSIQSLVADYGGFLGLSVGFNFLMIWECVLNIIEGIMKRKLSARR